MQESMGKDPETREFMARLLDRRNLVMVRRMLEAAERHPDKTMFVAVGAGHYPGPVGIVKLLRDTGFRVRRINDVAAMEKAWPAVSAPAASSRARPRSNRIRIGPFCLPRPGCCPK
jgi:pheromone shutdown protein TraB